MRAPPSSTLFPYTTLFRSRSSARGAARPRRSGRSPPPRFARPRTAARRSEEHTSELQSLAYLVCRLLLEKKKRKFPSESPRLTRQLLGPERRSREQTSELQ